MYTCGLLEAQKKDNKEEGTEEYTMLQAKKNMCVNRPTRDSAYLLVM